MKHVLLPDDSERRLTFYLAMEEFVARETDDESFFIWQVSPTVIFGRNQLMEAEVNEAYCREHGIRLVRRKSGGGCVYSDRGNLMLSYIVRGENVGFVFDCYLRRLAMMLQRIGVDARQAGRNDIQIGGRKVSGNAFYKLPGKSIVHGTLLFDTNLEHLQRAITPSEAKLKSKGVASVRQHVTNLSEHTDIDIETFKRYLIGGFCDGERTLSADDVRRIESIERTYTDDSFFSGSNPAYEIEKKAKIGDAGEITIGMEMKAGAIRRIHLAGDYFQISDPLPKLNAALHGVPLRREDVENALSGFDASAFIRNLSTRSLIELILKP